MEDHVLFELQEGLGDLISRAHERYLDCSDLSFEEAERLGAVLATIARDVHFWYGDFAKYVERKWPDTYHQVWPVFSSPGAHARTAGVCRAYPRRQDREHAATYTQYMQVAGKPDRQQLLAEAVGRTSDETRKDVVSNAPEPSDPKDRWLLAVDCNYYLHRWWHSGAGVEAASGVASWVERTANRLKEEKGLTDLVCCFDAKTNHRKELTTDWEKKYKDRPPKDPELGNQMNILRLLLAKSGYCTVSVDGFEADDVMASYARQFAGKVTLLTQDKDQRQCLSTSCNILLDVTWNQQEHTVDMIPEYKWLSSKQHTESTGIPPERWIDYQTIMGDNVDGIAGAVGIGKKGAADLVQRFPSVEAAIEAAKQGDESMKQKQRAALIEFEPRLEVTRQLVTLRTDLELPSNTRI